ncbi:MAG: class I SAM-dependent methyltransferase, partial [Halobacteriales archaeon]|nr:class I SAM-dependent methyltransferase [Halobacteriales archaeon]
MTSPAGGEDATLRDLFENRPRFPEIEEALPPRGYRRWALWRSAARFLGNLAVATGRRNILEFGSGTSSAVLAAALGRNGGGRLTALENLPAYSAEIWATVEDSPDTDAELIAAPLNLVMDRYGIRYRYAVDRAILERRGPFDLVFI